jgi:hypothetical protein
VWPIQSAVQWGLGFFLGVKQPERDVDPSLLSSADVKSDWSYASSSPVWRHGADRNYFASKVLNFSLLGPSLVSWKLICRCSMGANFMNYIDMHDHQHNNKNGTKL